jgi:phage-related protein
MAEPYFIYKNISSKDMGLLVNEVPPIIKVNRDINKITIPGRDGFLTEDFGTYGSTVKNCECTLLDIANVEQVVVWLDGSGEVIFSNQPDRKYKASILNQIPFERIMRQWYKFVVIFDCQPFGLAIENDVITLTAPATLYNIGTYKSKPVIKVYGNGSIDLTVNSKIVKLTNVVDYVVIDSDLMDCYKGILLKNNSMLGEFPELKVGENVIDWTGSVIKVEIQPRWCYL